MELLVLSPPLENILEDFGTFGKSLEESGTLGTAWSLCLVCYLLLDRGRADVGFV